MQGLAGLAYIVAPEEFDCKWLFKKMAPTGQTWAHQPQCTHFSFTVVDFKVT